MDCKTCTPHSKCKSKAFSIRGVGTSSENLDKIAIANGFIVFTPKDPNITNIFGFVDKSSTLPHVNSFVCVLPDNTWTISVNGKDLLKDHPVYKEKLLVNSNNANEIFKTISGLKFCSGNDDFPELIKQKIEADGTFKDANYSVKATIMSSNHSTLADLNVIRVNNCEILTNSSLRCKPCSTYRKYLNVCSSRILSPPSKYKPDVFRTKEELIDKSKSQSKEITLLKKSMARLHDKVLMLVKEEGKSISEPLEGINYIFSRF